MSEENKHQNKEEQQEDAFVRDEVVEISWEEIEQVVYMQTEFLRLKQSFGEFLANHERRKMATLQQIDGLESSIHQLASDIRQNKKVDPEATYELKLPSEVGEKGYFIRKEQ